MAITTDQHGVPLTAPTEAIATYDRALDALLRLHPDVVDETTALTTGHPGVAMGHALAAYLHLMSTDRRDLDTARAAAGELRARAELPREQAHADAVDAWVGGDWVGASCTLDALLQEWPRDLLALAHGHQLDFFLGDAANLRDRVARSLPEIDPAHPHLGYVHGMHAFGLEESGNYAQAEASGLAALATNERDVWATHAVVHTYEMQGRVDTGVRFLLEREAHWGSDNLFTVHNWWHLALYALEAGEPDRALAIFDAQIHTEDSSGVPIELLDASALLWRLLLDGVDVGPRFVRLAEAWRPLRQEEPWYGFNDVHAVMALAGAGALADGRAVVDRMERHLVSATGTNATTTAEVALPVSRAVIAFAEDRHRDVVTLLSPLRRTLHRFGGSHAQRDAWQRTLLESALRAGDAGLARALSAERVSARGDATYNWRQRARALRLAGDPARADAASARAAENQARFATAFTPT